MRPPKRSEHVLGTTKKLATKPKKSHELYKIWNTKTSKWSTENQLNWRSQSNALTITKMLKLIAPCATVGEML